VFGGREGLAVGEPARHQVSELPPIGVVVTEHRLHRVCCPGCGKTVRADLQGEIPGGSVRARLEAAVATLSVSGRE
jgi:transposase